MRKQKSKAKGKAVAREEGILNKNTASCTQMLKRTRSHNNLLANTLKSTQEIFKNKCYNTQPRTAFSNLSPNCTKHSQSTLSKSVGKTQQSTISINKLQGGERKNKKSKKNKINKNKSMKEEKQKVMNLSHCSAQAAPIQYFIYNNTPIAVQNSAQRRFVLKLNRVKQQQIHPKFQLIPKMNTQTNTSQIKLQQQGVNTISLQCQSFHTQTQFLQKRQRCFQQTLADLQFLYLPQPHHFQSLSSLQKQHYSELFKILANKIGTPLTAEYIHSLILQRQAIQIGAVFRCPPQGFPTTVQSSLCYLSNLFGLIGTKEDTISALNQFYGWNNIQKIRMWRRGYVRYQGRPILKDDIFIQLEEELFRGYQFSTKEMEQCVHIHNKALFDCFNQKIISYQPLYQSQGEVEMWTVGCNTTYLIQSDSIQYVLMEIKEAIQKIISSMCGLILPEQQHMRQLFYCKYNQKTIQKVFSKQVAAINFHNQTLHHYHALKYQISQCIGDILLKQFLDELTPDQ